MSDFTSRLDTVYGIVRLYIPKHKARKIRNSRATIRLYTTRGKPALLTGLGTFLAYESDIALYEIYNPNRLEFDLLKLQSDIELIHRYSFTEIVGNFRIVDFRTKVLRK